jgi:hypothetical protein
VTDAEAAALADLRALVAQMKERGGWYPVAILVAAPVAKLLASALDLKLEGLEGRFWRVGELDGCEVWTIDDGRLGVVVPATETS